MAACMKSTSVPGERPLSDYGEHTHTLFLLCSVAVGATYMRADSFLCLLACLLAFSLDSTSSWHGSSTTRPARRPSRVRCPSSSTPSAWTVATLARAPSQPATTTSSNKSARLLSDVRAHRGAGRQLAPGAVRLRGGGPTRAASSSALASSTSARRWACRARSTAPSSAWTRGRARDWRSSTQRTTSARA